MKEGSQGGGVKLSFDGGRSILTIDIASILNATAITITMLHPFALSGLSGSYVQRRKAGILTIDIASIFHATVITITMLDPFALSGLSGSYVELAAGAA